MHVAPYALLSALIVGAASGAAAGEAAKPFACASIKGFKADGLIVTQADEVPAGPAPIDLANPNGATQAPPLLPAHCRIAAELESRTGADAKPYAIRLELRVPGNWNGRFLYQGGGGLNGMVLAAVGNNISRGASAPPALSRGFAVASTDSGHAGSSPADTGFAADQEARINYGYASIGKVSAASKKLLRQLTGRPPAFSYFMGCSNGGREAMMAAQRFPYEFDGVIAGNPAFEVTRAALLSYFSGRVYQDAAKAAGTTAATLFTPADGALLRRSVLDACDQLDGARDGLVFDHAACKVDIGTLSCKPGQSGDCLAPEKTAAIIRAFSGPLDGAGRPVAGSWVLDGGAFLPDWHIWQTGLNTPRGEVTVMRDLVRASLLDLFAYPRPATEPGLSGEEMEKLLAATQASSAIIDATSTQMSSFAARGAKMILVTGWSDPIFSAPRLVDWYRKLSADSRAASGIDADGFARLYLVPGLSHCGGGAGLDDFDVLSPMVDWVENKVAPDAFPASRSGGDKASRPICAWPKIARYKGQGDPAASGSFECKGPDAGK